MSKVALGANGYGDWESSPFDEAFFITAAEYGVRSISFDSGPRSRVEISLPAALAFGFAEPTTGGERSLTDQMYCELDGDNFLEQLVKVRGSSRRDVRAGVSLVRPKVRAWIVGHSGKILLPRKVRFVIYPDKTGPPENLDTIL